MQGIIYILKYVYPVYVYDNVYIQKRSLGRKLTNSSKDWQRLAKDIEKDAINIESWMEERGKTTV